MLLNLETRADNRDGPPQKQRCNDAHVCHLAVIALNAACGVCIILHCLF